MAVALTSREAVAPAINFGLLAGGEFAARVVAFAGTAYLTRRLGPAAFGIVEFALVICSYAVFAVAAGFDSVGVRDVARDPRRARSLAAGGSLVRLALAALALAALAGVVAQLSTPAPVRLVIALTALTVVSTALDLSWVHKGLQRGRAVGLSLVLGQLVYVAILLTAVRTPDDVWIVPLALFGGQLAGAALLAWPLLPLRPTRDSARDGLRILAASGPMIASRLLRAVLLGGGLIMLGLWHDSRAVGLFGAASRVGFFIMAIGTALHVSYLPPLTRAVQAGTNETRHLLRRVLELSSSLIFPLVAGGALVAESLLSTLFGAPYAEAAPALRWLLLGVGCSFVHGLFRNILVARDRTGLDALIMGLAAAAALLLGALWIPGYGMTGAAAATGVAEALALVLTVAAVRRLGVRSNLGVAARIGVAALAMTGLLWSFGSTWPLSVSVAAGAVAYGALLALLGAVPAEVAAYLGGTRERPRT